MVSPAPPSNNTLSTGLFGVGAKFSGTCGSGLASIVARQAMMR